MRFLEAWLILGAINWTLNALFAKAMLARLRAVAPDMAIAQVRFQPVKLKQLPYFMILGLYPVLKGLVNGYKQSVQWRNQQK